MHWIAWPCLPPPDGHAPGRVAPPQRHGAAGVLPGAEPGGQAMQGLDIQGAEAWWALRFTPRVARVDEALLLEVSTTERLWGGRAALLAQLQACAPVAVPASAAGPAPAGPGGAQEAQRAQAAQGASLPWAQGPTSLQALALLRLQLAGQRQPRHVPHDLPLHTLTALRPHVASLARMGCNTWGQLRALPREGVARRLGAAALRVLDCAYGDAPHPHTWLELPEVFSLKAELPALATSADALLWSAHALLQALQAWLMARQQGVLALELAWHHDLRKVDGKPVPPWQALPVRTAQPTQALAHLRRLLAEHLARTPLAAPVNQIALRALQTAPMPHASASLLPPAGMVGRSAEDDTRSESWHQWVERLSARLGPEQVQCVALVSDHRPECMQRWHPASQAGAQGGAQGRASLGAQEPGGGGAASANSMPQAPDASLWPTWLLRPPLRLSVQGNRPCYQGPLRLLVGPHRLEAAWWEAALAGQPVAPSHSPHVPHVGHPAHSAHSAQPGNAAGSDAVGRGTSAARTAPTAEKAAAAPVATAATAPGLVVRDYFVAHNARAGHVWVFRERLAPSAPAQANAGAGLGAPAWQDRWFLHGIYG